MIKLLWNTEGVSAGGQVTEGHGVSEQQKTQLKPAAGFQIQSYIRGSFYFSLTTEKFSSAELNSKNTERKGDGTKVS